MNAAFEDCRRIALVTTVQRDATSLKVMRIVAAVLALLLVIGGGIAAARHQLNPGLMARGVLFMLGLWLALVWATLFVPGAVLLNSPVNARLLPRQRRRLIQMTAAGWLACTLIFAGVFGSWAVLPLCGIYLIGLPLMLTGHRQAGPLVFLACGWPALSRAVLPSWLVAQVSGPASVALLCALLLAVGAYALGLLYPAGGDAVMDRRGEQVKRIQRASARGAPDTGDVGGPALKGTRQVYSLALRRDCRRADPATMLMHALGPVAHWTAWLGAATALVVGGACVHLLITRRLHGGLDEALHVAASVGTAALAAIVVFVTAQFGQQLRRTRGEQALLRLTPLAGDSALLNRRLASQLLRGGLHNWGMMTGCILVATVLAGADGSVVLRQFALCCLAGQVAMIGLLGDYAGAGGWNLMLGLRAAVLAALEAGVAVGLAWLTHAWVWPWLIAIALVGAVIQLRRSWRRMLAAPCAFPAGRMA